MTTNEVTEPVTTADPTPVYPQPKPPRGRVQVSFDPAEDRTSQQFANESNINEIIRRAGGLVPMNPYPNLPAKTAPQYGDFYDVGDLADSLARVNRAEDLFLELPATVRALADHDVQNFMEGLRSPEFVDQITETLGRPFGPSVGDSAALGTDSPSDHAPEPAAPAPSGPEGTKPR